MKIELSKKFQQQMELMKSASAANSSSYDSVMRVEAVENIDKLNNSCSYDLVEEEDAKK